MRRIKNVFRGGADFALFQVVAGIAGADGDELQHARVAVAIDHAPGAAVADEFRLVELVDVAHGRFPEMAAIQVQVPIEIKIFMPAQAAEFFWFSCARCRCISLSDSVGFTTGYPL